MVGQIAGQPVYAHDVLADMDAQLATLGSRLPPAAFRQQVTRLIYQTLAGLVRDRLLEAEARRQLDTNQHAQIDSYIAFQRGELLRKYGQGSLSLAENNFFEETGQTLSERLDDQRTGATISLYFDRKLRPLVSVSRRDIERFYRDNFETFNPPPKREIQFIYAENQTDAAWFQQQLDAGASFAQLADDEKNLYPGKANLYAVEGRGSMFGSPIDPAIEGLTQGQWAGPLPHRGQQWFVSLATFDQPVGRSLFEAQIDIERELRKRGEREIEIELGQRRRLEGSFTSERKMAEAIIEIAVARYAASP